jgi:hypothetical protein
MEVMQVAYKIQLRGDTAANFTSVNPTLADRELAVETDTGKLKIGDGTTAWTSLAYFNAAAIPEDIVDAKGDILAATAADTIARLPVGTNGQVLSADSTETTGLKWVDASGGSSPLTTKGDLYGYTTTDARIPVGTNGQVLEADSTQATGLKWGEKTKQFYTVSFNIITEVSNTIDWFYLGVAPGGATGTQQPGTSLNNSGIQNSNAANPFVVPVDSTLIGATCVLRGAGVQANPPTYPVTLNLDLYSLGFSSKGTKIQDLDFSISSAFTVGSYSPAATNYTGTLTGLTQSVSAGDMLGLEFKNGNGASIVGQIKNCFVTLYFEVD